MNEWREIGERHLWTIPYVCPYFTYLSKLTDRFILNIKYFQFSGFCHCNSDSDHSKQTNKKKVSLKYLILCSCCCWWCSVLKNLFHFYTSSYILNKYFFLLNFIFLNCFFFFFLKKEPKSVVHNLNLVIKFITYSLALRRYRWHSEILIGHVLDFEFSFENLFVPWHALLLVSLGVRVASFPVLSFSIRQSVTACERGFEKRNRKFRLESKTKQFCLKISCDFSFIPKL